FDFMTFIPFKFPLSTNLPGSDVLVRTYKREDGNCSSDAVDWFNYTNYFPASVAVESTYRSFGRSITFEQVGAYRAVADRNGGAFYEFYNLRMGDPTLPHNDENAIFANMGAALQVMAIAGQKYDLDPDPCNGYGFWNPN